MRTLSTILIAAVILAIPALPLRAEVPKPTVVVAVPTSFDFTEDKGQKDVKADSPTGYRAHFITPWVFGIGVANYKSAIQSKSLPGLPGDLGTDYSFLEITANVTFGPVMLGYGYGAGKITYDPKKQSVDLGGGFTYNITRKQSDVTERFLTVGIYVTPSWSIQAAWHALYAQVDQKQDINGVVTKENRDDLGAIMTTVGVGYSF